MEILERLVMNMSHAREGGEEKQNKRKDWNGREKNQVTKMAQLHQEELHREGQFNHCFRGGGMTAPNLLKVDSEGCWEKLKARSSLTC